MTTTWVIAGTAMLAGLAIGAASPASADPEKPTGPQMSGHYIETSTASTGQSTSNDWYVTPCGDGCASVGRATGGQPYGEARLVNGQWTMDSTDDQVCREGNVVPNAYTSHYSWDPTALVGTIQVTYKVSACGRHQPGDTGQFTMQLRQAP